MNFSLLLVEEALSSFVECLIHYAHALADKALVQSFLGQYEVALSTIDQAHAIVEMGPQDRDPILDNRCAIFVLAGVFSDALELLQARLERFPEDSDLRFMLATCLLHLERYDDAVFAYEQAIAEDSYLRDERCFIVLIHFFVASSWDAEYG